MEAGFSTRMGAAMRHAGHYLSHQEADKKLLLVITDGEPADIDTKDERLLIEDARIAVRELDQKGIYTYCITLDPDADAQCSAARPEWVRVPNPPDRLRRLPAYAISILRQWDKASAARTLIPTRSPPR